LCHVLDAQVKAPRAQDPKYQTQVSSTSPLPRCKVSNAERCAVSVLCTLSQFSRTCTLQRLFMHSPTTTTKNPKGRKPPRSEQIQQISLSSGVMQDVVWNRRSKDPLPSLTYKPTVRNTHNAVEEIAKSMVQGTEADDMKYCKPWRAEAAANLGYADLQVWRPQLALPPSNQNATVFQNFGPQSSARLPVSYQISKHRNLHPTTGRSQMGHGAEP